MNNLSTRELIFLEDMSKLFESIEKTCKRAITESNDAQLTNTLQSIATQHQQWIQATANLVNKGTIQ